ncbi:MAG: hypothetical protein ABGX33_05345 [Cycloclasticus sp.]|jgi:tetratricopeptide (TPR) repeat protein|nr:tetratricopeptide repeat protein [Cycloclasticus sp.]HIL92895.1 tetratricopeptide repeat protein [Cycloclasticus sp.]
MPQINKISAQRFTNILQTVCFCIVVALCIQLCTSNAVYAADKESKKYANVKTKKRQAVGKKCGKKLEAIQLEIDAEKWSSAKSSLKASLTKSCSTSYEKSQVWNYLAYVYFSLDDLKQAINAYKKVIAEKDTDERQRVNVYYSIAQLYMVTENYSSAAKFLEKWMKESTVVSADGQVLLAQAYYQMDRKNDSLRLVNKAINDWESKGKVPKENWWGLQRVIYYEQNKFPKVVGILKKLIKHYSKNTYWRQLGGMYGELNQDMNQLISTEVVYLVGDLKKGRDLLGLAYLFIGANAPYLAARVIDKGIESKIIEPTAKNLEFLGHAWQLSQEGKKARTALEKAAKVSDKGQIWARLANVYLNLGQDTKAVSAARLALKKGNIKRADLTYMVLGNSQLNLHCYDSAQDAFRRAAKDKRSNKNANQWILYAKSEGSRRNKLRESGVKLKGCHKA